MDVSLAANSKKVNPEDSDSSFPNEILCEIFSYCDAPSLAALSRASFRYLALTSKLLYTDITLTDAKSIAILLRLESSAQTQPSTSDQVSEDRVSEYTSLSLVKTFTYHAVRTVTTELDLLAAYKNLPRPLTLDVLAVSLPPPWQHTFDSSPSASPAADENARDRVSQPMRIPASQLEPVLALFNPVRLIVRGRQDDSSFGDNIRFSVGHLNRSWDRLSIVYQSGAHIEYDEIAALCRCAASHLVALPVVWDLLDPKSEMGKYHIQNLIWRRLLDLKILAWVDTDVLKDDMIASFREDAPQISPLIERALGKTLLIEVPKAQVRRLRDEIVRHGVMKDMNWAALDDL